MTMTAEACLHMCQDAKLRTGVKTQQRRLRCFGGTCLFHFSVFVIELWNHNSFLKYWNIQTRYRVKIFNVLCWKLKVMISFSVVVWAFYWFSFTFLILMYFHYTQWEWCFLWKETKAFPPRSCPLGIQILNCPVRNERLGKNLWLPSLLPKRFRPGDLRQGDPRLLCRPNLHGVWCTGGVRVGTH